MPHAITEDLNRFKSAYGEGFDFHDENLMMLGWYANRIVHSLSGKNDLRILSLGIGYEVVPKAILNGLGSRLGHYTIIDGASDIVEKFRQNGTPPLVKIVLDYFENFTSETRYDVIEMGFILEHVDDPGMILEKYRAILADGGRMFIAVPNAASLHRIIGHAAGLLDNIYRLSPQDLELGHKRYFDCESITSLILGHGLKIVAMEGIFLKPLTTAQLNQLGLSSSIWKALCTVAQGRPAISNSIFIEATI